jgi:hypothetical protein
MDLDSDMNATPLSKLQPVVQTRADAPRVDPPNYTDLLNTMDVHSQPAAPQVQYYQEPQPDMYATQPPQYVQQQPQIVYVPEPAAPVAEPAAGGTLTRLLRQHKDILIVAALAFAAMHFGAPRLRGVSALVNSTGGLNMLGLGLLALAIGFGTRASAMI